MRMMPPAQHYAITIERKAGRVAHLHDDIAVILIASLSRSGRP